LELLKVSFGTVDDGTADGAALGTVEGVTHGTVDGTTLGAVEVAALDAAWYLVILMALGAFEGAALGSVDT
jgi:hypothetical protein